MAQQHLDPPTDPTGGPVTSDALAGYLRAQATEFLRSLRQHRETGAGAASGSAESVAAARALRRSARRISGSLHTFRPLLDTDWSEGMRPELAWLSGTLAREHAYGARLERLLGALNRLSGSAAVPAQAAGANAHTAPKGSLTVGAAKAGALLDRQLTLARTRAHSAALQALGSSRFHAVADSVAVLASEVPLTPAAPATDLRPLAAAAADRLTDAVAALPLVTAGHPYNAQALVHGLSADTAPQPQDTPGTRSACCCGCTATPANSCTATSAPPTYGSSPRARPSTGTGTRRRRHRPRPRRPAPHGSPRRRRTRSACSTPTSGTRSRRHGSRSSRHGRRKRYAPSEGGPMADDTIQAAGCVLWRRSPVDGELEICLVHRPKYDDWSHPKGKLKRAEDPLTGALREVEEETGYTAAPGAAPPHPPLRRRRPPQGSPLLGSRGNDGPLHPEPRG